MPILLELIQRDFGQNAGGRIGRFAGPIAVEVPRHVLDDRTECEHVEIEEQALVARAEIFIADIASADDGRLIVGGETLVVHAPIRSEEQTSELQSLMRISYAVLCLKNKT